MGNLNHNMVLLSEIRDKRFKDYSKYFDCSFEEVCYYEPYDSMEDGLESVKSMIEEIFETKTIPDREIKNCINLIFRKGFKPTFSRPTMRNNYSIMIQFKYKQDGNEFLYSSIVKPSLFKEGAWDNFFDTKAIEKDSVTLIPQTYIENCKNDLLGVLEKFQVINLAITLPEKNSESDPVRMVSELFGTSLAETSLHTFGPVKSYLYVDKHNLKFLPFLSPENTGIIVVCINVDGVEKRIQIILKQVVQHLWEEHYKELYEKMLQKSNNISMSGEKPLKEYVRIFYKNRRDNSIETCLLKIFGFPITFDESSVKCFGTTHVSIIFSGLWNGHKSFFKITLQSYTNEQILNYFDENQETLTTTHPNLCKILKHETSLEFRKRNFFFDMMVKNMKVTDEIIDRLTYLDRLQITVQELLSPPYESLKEFSMKMKKIDVIDIIINDSIKILNQLDSLDIIHQDIADDNVMIRKLNDSFCLVLIDFDFSDMYCTEKEYPRKSRKTDVGSFIYKPPYWCEEKDTNIGDIYSMSIVMFELVYFVVTEHKFKDKVDNVENDEAFRMEILQYLKRKGNEIEQIMPNFDEFSTLIQYMLYYEKKPVLSNIKYKI